ncbi:MAG: hypothetical protein IPH86_01695 [bacterium]|nr:hypothetical protein [bacterium]MBK7671234.1 hypothetical protein [bacterium]
MDSSYQQAPLEGGRVRFTVTPAAPPKSKGAANVIAVIFALVVIGSTPAHTPSLLVFLRLVLAVAGGWFVRKWVNKWFAGKVDRIRSPGGTFVVSPDGIEAPNGATITRDQLHRLIVRNGVPDFQGGAVAVDTGTMYSAMQAGAANDRAVNRARASAVAYMLCAESGGRSTTLAGGMTEVTANGLLTDVSRVLGLARA